MSRFVRIGRDTFWQESADQLIQIPSADGLGSIPAAGVGAELLAAPGFLEFISAADAQLVELCFAKKCAYADDRCLYVDYTSALINRYSASIDIDIATGVQTIECHYGGLFYSYRPNEFKLQCPDYYALCIRIGGLQEEIARLKAETERLRAENLELRVRPGGPDYEAARERFEAGDYHA